MKQIGSPINENSEKSIGALIEKGTSLIAFSSALTQLQFPSDDANDNDSALFPTGKIPRNFQINK